MIMAAANGKAYGRKQGIPRKYLFPYDLVERGDEGKVIKKGEATQEEYVLGLKRMEAQASIRPPIRSPTPTWRFQSSKKQSHRTTAHCPGRPLGATRRYLQG